MATISKLMDKVLSLPKDTLLPGTPIKERKKELRILSLLAPKLENVKRGCFLINGNVEIHVRIFLPKYLPPHIHRDLVIKRNDGRDEVTFDNFILHLNSVAEVHEYISKICSEEHTY